MSKRIADLTEANIDTPFGCTGWLTRLEKRKKMAFGAISDGSSGMLQFVIRKDRFDDFSDLFERGSVGASVKIDGTIVASPGAGQPFELSPNTVEVIGTVADIASYKFGAKRMKSATQETHLKSMEEIRQYCHQRARDPTFASVMRIRSAADFACHGFYYERGFTRIHTPIITQSDCEGAGEAFQLCPVSGREFFGDPAFLTVSGQLELETFYPMGPVYTFGPTFRAENSHTKRHLAEFWMIEAEIITESLEELLQVEENFLKYVIAHVLTFCQQDLSRLEETISPDRIAYLQSILDADFVRLPYGEAIKLLQKTVDEDGTEFKVYPAWGIDLGAEHEKWITEQHFGCPVFITNYPAIIKAFYMLYDPPTEDGLQTVAAADLLVPGIGEIIGGSLREHRLELLIQKMQQLGVHQEALEFYLQLRRDGTVPHGGFGLGFERLVMLLTGVQNIRDTIPFPRWAGHCS